MEEKEKTPLECLQEDIKIFRKNEEAIYDAFALYQVLTITEDEPYSLVVATLAERVIHDLEDPQVTIRLKMENVEEFIGQKTDMVYGIVWKYKNIEECKITYDEFFGCYKENIALKDFPHRKANFDLASLLIKRYPELVYKFLVSEIPFKIRLNMFGSALSSLSAGGLKSFFALMENKMDYLSNEEWNKLPEKITELIDAFNHNECDFFRVEDLLENLLTENIEILIDLFLNNGINFNNCYFRYPFADAGSSTYENDKVSLVGLLVNRYPSVFIIKELYEHETYLTVVKSARDNNDELILANIPRIEICDFIGFSHFKITEEKVYLLASSVMSCFDRHSLSFIKNNREGLILNNKNIALAILRKAKNKQEYQQMKRYVSLFNQLADIDVEIARREEIEKNKELNLKMIAQKRNELTNLLKQMNEFAQENVPGKRLLKEIEWDKANISL